MVTKMRFSLLSTDDFHKNLRDLLAKLLIEKIPSWKSEALNNLGMH